MDTLFIFIAIIVLLVVAILVFFVSQNRAENHLTPMAGLAFGFIVAGILFSGVRILGYGMMAAGVIIAVVDIFKRPKRS